MFQVYTIAVVLYVCIYFFRFFSIISYYMILNIAPRAVPSVLIDFVTLNYFVSLFTFHM